MSLTSDQIHQRREQEYIKVRNQLAELQEKVRLYIERTDRKSNKERKA